MLVFTKGPQETIEIFDDITGEKITIRVIEIKSKKEGNKVTIEISAPGYIKKQLSENWKIWKIARARK